MIFNIAEKLIHHTQILLYYHYVHIFTIIINFNIYLLLSYKKMKIFRNIYNDFDIRITILHYFFRNKNKHC